MRLPHLETPDGTYFITICRHGAIPKDVAAEIRRKRRELENFKGAELLDRQRCIFREMEKWLDRTDCVHDLNRPDIAAIIIDAMQHRQEDGTWHVIEYTIMPNHIHIFAGRLNRAIIPLLKDFKRWTGQEAAKLLGRKHERFWAREWFDHYSRSPEESEKIVRYIQMNPVKAGLVADYTDWKFAGWSKPIR